MTAISTRSSGVPIHHPRAVSIGAPSDHRPDNTWGPALTLVGLAVIPTGLAVALLRNRWHWAGGTQVLVAMALCVAALASAVQERPDPWSDRDPAPTVTPSPAWNSPPCRSGGDNSECARSGG
ncbi:DUF6234 family protein [Streptomyces sp. SR-10]|uniref:DUF6234 family protein n=1 Tax=Streptomyces sp. SR-10 TaxID=3416442 RepID=UPI003CF3F774